MRSAAVKAGLGSTESEPRASRGSFLSNSCPAAERSEMNLMNRHGPCHLSSSMRTSVRKPTSELANHGKKCNLLKRKVVCNLSKLGGLQPFQKVVCNLSKLG